MRTRRPLSRAARLTKEWMGFFTAEPDFLTPQSVLLGANSGFMAWILDPAGALELFDEPTVLRTRIAVTPAFNTLPAASICSLSCGIIVADRGLPSTALAMSPLDFSADDWIWWGNWQLVAPPAGAVPATWASTQQNQWDDVKTKRRVEGGAGLLFVAHHYSDGATDCAFGMAGRMLLGH